MDPMALIINIAILIIAMIIGTRLVLGFLLPRRSHGSRLTTMLAHDFILWIVHLIFGSPKVRIARPRRRRRRY